MRLLHNASAYGIAKNKRNGGGAKISAGINGRHDRGASSYHGVTRRNLKRHQLGSMP